MKKTKRDLSKYPYLDLKLTTKLRKDYLDNIECINGVKNSKGDTVIRAYNDEELEFLNKFNKEYYNAEFDEDDDKNLHKTLIDDETLKVIRKDISTIRKQITELSFNARNSDKIKALYVELNELIEYLTVVYPKKLCTDNNNSINRCLLNAHGGGSKDIRTYNNYDIDSLIENSTSLEHLMTHDLQIDETNDYMIDEVIDDITKYLNKKKSLDKLT
jgi:cephalosporin-C deacetylase-like acetyl esterase